MQVTTDHHQAAETATTAKEVKAAEKVRPVVLK